MLQLRGQMSTECSLRYEDNFNGNLQFSFFQGARWDLTLNCLTDSRLKELHPSLPIMLVKAVTQDVAVS